MAWAANEKRSLRNFDSRTSASLMALASAPAAIACVLALAHMSAASVYAAEASSNIPEFSRVDAIAIASLALKRS